MTLRRIYFLSSLIGFLALGGLTVGYEPLRDSATHDNRPPEALDDSLLPPIDPFLLNPIVPGSKRGSREYTPANLLGKRQNNGTCTQPGYVLVCPITEATPCCAPGYPICCHEPSDTCCPSGSFCQGLHTCCRNGSTGCGEGCCVAGVPCCNNTCCPSSAYVCDASSGTPTCVTNGTVLASTSSYSSATVTFPTQAPTDTSQPTKTNNTALIAGASAGGAVALILIALGAYCALKKRPATPLGTQPKETRIDLAPTPVPYITPSADRRYSHMSTVPLARPAVPSLVGTQPTVSTVGSVLGDVSTHGPSSAYTGMGYTPSPAPAETTAASSQSGRGASYYASTPIYDLGGVSTTSQTSSNPNLATSSQRRSNTLSSQAGIANAIPPWLNGSVVSHGTNDNPMPSTSPPLGSQAAVRADISPVGSPPPPAFSPPPLDLGEGGVGYAPWAYPPEDINSGAGRVISTDAPRDTKARPSGRRV